MSTDRSVFGEGRRGGAGRAERSGSLALVVMLVVSPQLLGGVFPWSIAIICAMAAVTGLLTGLQMETTRGAIRGLQPLDWAIVAALVWTGLQLVPLPAGWVAYFVPESVEAWRSADSLLGRAPHSWMPLSLDPGATRLELAKGSAIVVAYLVARAQASVERRDWVFVAAGMSGTTMALVALAHRLANANAVFGLYEPVYAGTRLLAPLMNENHLAGFMALTTPVTVGLALDARRREHQFAWIVAALCCGVSCVFTLSRGGIGALALGLGIFVSAAAMRSRGLENGIRGRRVAATGAALLVVVGLVVAFAVPELRREFGYTHNRTAKFEAAAAAMPLIAEHWMTGIGRGAFSVAFVGEHGSAKRFFYPENLVVQWTSEWGLVFGMGLLLLIAWSLARAFTRLESLAFAGALAGLIALGTQQLVDFSLELAGVAVVAAAILGALVRSDARGFGPSLKAWLLASSMVAIAGTWIAGSLRQRDSQTLEAQIRGSLTEGNVEETRARVEDGMLLHPAEPTFVLIGAELALRTGSGEVGAWINRAQQLAPKWSAPHLLAARWLWSVGRTDQALVELRVAEQNHPGSMVQLVCALLKDHPQIELVDRVTPPGTEGGLFLDRVSQCLPWSTPLAAKLDASALERDPNLSGPMLRQARRMTLEGRDEEVIQWLEARSSADPSMSVVLAEAYLRSGRLDEAAAQIAPVVSSANASDKAMRVALAIQVALKNDQAVESLASRLRSKTNGRSESLAELELYLGARYEEAGRFDLALAAYRRANRAVESRKSLEAVARVCRETGDTIGAIIAYRSLCRKDGAQGKACAMAQELERRTGTVP